jgi:RHS repeat-associated protein
MDRYDYTYDLNGNMRSEGTSRHFEWNHSDEMKAFRTHTLGAEPSVHAHYLHLYDAAGQRVKKLVRKQGGRVEVTHYIDGAFEHHRWGGVANNHVHVIDDTQRVALVRLGNAHPDDRGPAAQFHLGDRLGSSNVVIDANGNSINREEFTPYGETSFGSFTRKRYRFTGMERDEESGLSYHGARSYAPWLGRWVSCDPISLEGGLNLYNYCSANPIMKTDKTGTEEWGIDIDEIRAVSNGGSPTDPYNKQFLDQFTNRRTKYTGFFQPIQTFSQTFEEVSLDAAQKAGHVAFQEASGKMLVQRFGDTVELRNISLWAEQQAKGASRGAIKGSANRLIRDLIKGNRVVPEGLRKDVNLVRQALGQLGIDHKTLKIPGTRLPQIGTTGLRYIPSKILDAAAKGARVVGYVVTGYYVVKRGFLAGYYLREGEYGEAALQGLYLMEDLSPIPSPRPAKIGFVGPGENTQWTADPRGMFGLRSGCTVCHESVRIDNWAKTTPEGRAYEELNGPATTIHGIATDAALKAFYGNDVFKNPS